MKRLHLIQYILLLLFVCLPLSAQQYLVSTIAGPGVTPTTTPTTSGGLIGDGALATAAILVGPVAVARTSSNTLILENGACRVRSIDTSGNITTIAGINATTASGPNQLTVGQCGFVGDAGPATSALFSSPQGMAVDSTGAIYIADTDNFVIRKFTAGGNVSTVAGTANNAGYGGDGGSATSAQLHFPRAVAVDSSNNIYIADDARIRKVTGSTITTIAGGINPGFAGDGGSALAAQFNSPQGLLVDSAGNVYVADTFNSRVRKISGGTVTTIAGTGVSGSSGDGGLATSAQLRAPAGLALDGAGNLYIAEHNRIRRVDTKGIITTVAGTGVDGYSGDGGLAVNATFSNILGISIDSTGNIYVADSFNNVVRKLAVQSVATVTNSASNLPGNIAPGELITIYGVGMAPDPIAYQPVVYNNFPQGQFVNALNGVQVLINGVPAPMIYESSKQIAAIVPYSTQVGSVATIQILSGGVTTAAGTATVVATRPDIFTKDSSGVGQAAALNQDSSANSASNPASAGQAVVLYVTGEGLTNPSGIDGVLASGNVATLPKPVLPVTATIGGGTPIPVNVEYAGAAPGLVAGVMQVNIRLPLNSPTGNAVPVRVTVGTTTSVSTVTIAVK